MSYIEVFPNIIICPDQPPGFDTAVRDVIARIASRPIGKRLLDKIAKANHVAWLTIGERSETTFYDALGAVTKGKGSDAEIRLSLVTRAMISFDVKEAESPFFIDCVHEFIHLYRGFYGKNRSMGNVACKELWQDDDEYETMVGFPSKKDRERTKPKITENTIREEHSLPQVYTHLFASELIKPGLSEEIKFQSLAHRTTIAFQQLLASSDFLKNSNRLFYITSKKEEEAANETLSDLQKASDGNVVLVKPNLNSTPPVLGKINRLY